MVGLLQKWSHCRELFWADEIRFLVIFIVRSAKFKCCFEHAKRSFCRSANGIFAKVGRLASEEVILELLRSLWLPVLLYGLEVCALRSLAFSFSRFLNEIFEITNMKIVRACHETFQCVLPCAQLIERYNLLHCIVNVLCLVKFVTYRFSILAPCVTPGILLVVLLPAMDTIVYVCVLSYFCCSLPFLCCLCSFSPYYSE